MSKTESIGQIIKLISLVLDLSPEYILKGFLMNFLLISFFKPLLALT